MGYRGPHSPPEGALNTQVRGCEAGYGKVLSIIQELVWDLIRTVTKSKKLTQNILQSQSQYKDFNYEVTLYEIQSYVLSSRNRQ